MDQIEKSPNPSSHRSILYARRVAARILPGPTVELQKAGLRYERKVIKVLKSCGWKVEHNPWFEFEQKFSTSAYFYGDAPISFCSPDAIVLMDSKVVVVEIKLSATPRALEKLETLYCPVVEKALGLTTKPLVVTKSLKNWGGGKIPDRIRGIDGGLSFTASLQETVDSVLPVYLWLGKGKIT